MRLNVEYRAALKQASRIETDTRDIRIRLQTIYDLGERICPTLSENGAKYGVLKMYCDAQLELVRLYASVPRALGSAGEAAPEGGDGIDVERWVRNEEDMLRCLVLNWGCGRVAGVKQLLIHFRVNAKLILREEGGTARGGEEVRGARIVNDDMSALDSDEAASNGGSSIVASEYYSADEEQS